MARNALVMGGGPIGLAMIQLLRVAGYSTMGVGPINGIDRFSIGMFAIADVLNQADAHDSKKTGAVLIPEPKGRSTVACLSRNSTIFCQSSANPASSAR